MTKLSASSRLATNAQLRRGSERDQHQRRRGSWCGSPRARRARARQVLEPAHRERDAGRARRNSRAQRRPTRPGAPRRARARAAKISARTQDAEHEPGAQRRTACRAPRASRGAAAARCRRARGARTAATPPAACTALRPALVVARAPATRRILPLEVFSTVCGGASTMSSAGAPISVDRELVDAWRSSLVRARRRGSRVSASTTTRSVPLRGVGRCRTPRRSRVRTPARSPTASSSS